MFHQPSTFGDGLAVDPEWFRASEDPVIRLELIARMLLKLGPNPTTRSKSGLGFAHHKGDAAWGRVPVAR